MSYYHIMRMVASLGVVVSGCVSCTRDGDGATRPRAVEWDLSELHDKRSVGWPESVLGDHYELSDVGVKITVGNARVFASYAAHVYLDADHDKLTELTVDLPPEALNNVCARADQLKVYWDMIGQNFVRWRARAASGDVPTYDTHTRAGVAPEASLTIAPATGSGWHVLFRLYWGNASGTPTGPSPTATRPTTRD